MSQGAVLATRRCDLDEHLVQEFYEEKTCSNPQLHWEQPPGGGSHIWILDQSVASRLNVFVRGSDVGSLDPHRAVPSIEIQLG